MLLQMKNIITGIIQRLMKRIEAALGSLPVGWEAIVNLA